MQTSNELLTQLDRIESDLELLEAELEVTIARQRVAEIEFLKE